jgi:signal-transduction protein with cAMP-binding, CBS, and nucleotidyltransferase domain
MTPGDSDDYELSNHRYQPGEEILAAGRVDRYVYLITEGYVRLQGPEGERRLGPGEHFGMTGQDFRVVAETEVMALAVREDQVARLKQVLGALAQVTA